MQKEERRKTIAMKVCRYIIIGAWKNRCVMIIRKEEEGERSRRRARYGGNSNGEKSGIVNGKGKGGRIDSIEFTPTYAPLIEKRT
jgi:hypothetical protein